MRWLLGATEKPATAAFDDDDGDFTRYSYIINGSRLFRVRSCDLDDTSRRLNRVLTRICDFMFAEMGELEYFLYRRESPAVKQKMVDIKREHRTGGLEAVELFLDRHAHEH
jgi:hypothetical protein